MRSNFPDQMSRLVHCVDLPVAFSSLERITREQWRWEDEPALAKALDLRLNELILHPSSDRFQYSSFQLRIAN